MNVVHSLVFLPTVVLNGTSADSFLIRMGRWGLSPCLHIHWGTSPMAFWPPQTPNLPHYLGCLQTYNEYTTKGQLYKYCKDENTNLGLKKKKKKCCTSLLCFLCPVVQEFVQVFLWLCWSLLEWPTHSPVRPHTQGSQWAAPTSSKVHWPLHQGFLPSSLWRANKLLQINEIICNCPFSDYVLFFKEKWKLNTH